MIHCLVAFSVVCADSATERLIMESPEAAVARRPGVAARAGRGRRRAWSANGPGARTGPDASGPDASGGGRGRGRGGAGGANGPGAGTGPDGSGPDAGGAEARAAGAGAAEMGCRQP